MQCFTVSLFGHRRLEDAALTEKRLEALVKRLLAENPYVEFLVGRDGDFDLLAASVIRRCRRSFREDNSALVLVLPYETAEYRANADAFHTYYDEVEICDRSAGAHFKAAHQLRNRAMADRSDLVVVWVQHPRGGAREIYRYAQKAGIRTLNLAEEASCFSAAP